MKSCSLCKLDKPTEEYNKNLSKKDGLQTFCRSCNKEKARVYYRLNQEKYRVKTSTRKKLLIEENQKKMWKLLTRGQYVDCGNKNPMVLEFDHLTEKEAGVSTLLCEGYSWSRISKEIEKCVLRCANCHNIKTHKEKNSYRWKMFYRTVDSFS
jgi:hypothetical protein